MSGINLDLIKKRLGEVNNGGNGSRDMSKKSSFWKPEAGDYRIRIVPYLHNPQNPFVEVETYGYLDRGTVSPKNWGEPDPVDEVMQAIRRKSNDDIKSGKPNEDWKIAGKLRSSIRFNVPVVVRGQENNGVLIWRFGKEIYNMLCNILIDPEYGDFTDVYQGRDFTVTFARNPNGNGHVVSSCVPRPKETPLADDANLVKKLLEEQPNILEEYAPFKKDYVTLKDLIKEYLIKLQTGEIPLYSPRKQDAAPVVEQKPTIVQEEKAVVEVPTLSPYAGMASIDVPVDQKKKDVAESFDSYFQDEE